MPEEAPWQEYTDNATGKTYYSNGKTTSWEKPESMSTTSTETPTDNDSNPPPWKKAKKEVPVEFASKTEAIAAFKGFLIAKNVAPTLKWHEVTKLFSSETRWKSCESALSTGERKQALAEYQTKKANQLKLLERQEKTRSREAFTELLNSVLAKDPSFSAWHSRFDVWREGLVRDERFHAVADEHTREALFVDFCEDMKKRIERKKLQAERETRSSFFEFLQEKQVSLSSSWHEFFSGLSEAELADSRFAASDSLSEHDRQHFFMEFLMQGREQEQREKRRERQAEMQLADEQKNSFVRTLESLASDQKLVPWSRWSDIEDKLVDDESYVTLNKRRPSAPREEFRVFIDSWYRRYKDDKLILSRITKPATGPHLVVNSDMSYETFTNALLESASSSAITDLEFVKEIIERDDPTSSARLFYTELQSSSQSLRRSRADDQSSEDEGEIIEEDATS